MKHLKKERGGDFIPIPNENFNWFLYWICERQNIWWKKYNGVQGDLTEDEILKNFKFTNVYRCLDRVSQYLLKNVIYNGKEYEPEDMFFRILLFKHFNKNETWDLLEKEFGEITYSTGLDNIADFLDTVIDSGETIYSSAYIVNCFFYQYPEYKHITGLSKHRAHFRIFEDEIFQNGHIYDFLDAKSFEELYWVFRKMKIYGDFTAQQYVIDMNYSPLFDFTENEFVITGPGSLKGIVWTFEGANGKKYDYVGTIKWVHDNFEELMGKFCEESGMKWNPLPWEPVPTLTNLQNCFCETSKFAKGLGHSFKKGVSERIKNTYERRANDINFVFPPKWNAVLPKKGEFIVE